MICYILVDNFQIPIQFGMKLCSKFDHTIQALYKKEYLQVPDDVDLCSINQLHHAMSMEWVVHWVPSIAHPQFGKIAQRNGQVPIKEKKIAPKLF